MCTEPFQSELDTFYVNAPSYDVWNPPYNQLTEIQKSKISGNGMTTYSGSYDFYGGGSAFYGQFIYQGYLNQPQTEPFFGNYPRPIIWSCPDGLTDLYNWTGGTLPTRCFSGTGDIQNFTPDLIQTNQWKYSLQSWPCVPQTPVKIYTFNSVIDGPIITGPPVDASGNPTTCYQLQNDVPEDAWTNPGYNTCITNWGSTGTTGLIPNQIVMPCQSEVYYPGPIDSSQEGALPVSSAVQQQCATAQHAYLTTPQPNSSTNPPSLVCNTSTPAVNPSTNGIPTVLGYPLAGGEAEQASGTQFCSCNCQLYTDKQTCDGICTDQANQNFQYAEEMKQNGWSIDGTGVVATCTQKPNLGQFPSQQVCLQVLSNRVVHPSTNTLKYGIIIGVSILGLMIALFLYYVLSSNGYSTIEIVSLVATVILITIGIDVLIWIYYK